MKRKSEVFVALEVVNFEMHSGHAEPEIALRSSQSRAWQPARRFGKGNEHQQFFFILALFIRLRSISACAIVQRRLWGTVATCPELDAHVADVPRCRSSIRVC
jgi:hypothetical protein